MNMTRRLAWTMVTGLLLSSLYGTYAGLVSPLLLVPQKTRALSDTSADFPSGPPPENAVWARRFLPEWAETARWQGRWGRTYFFAGQQESIAADAAVRCAPFALLHIPDVSRPEAPGRVPVIILADAAVIRFPDSVDLDDPDPRMALGCRLDGAVEITGADGLSIRGGNFVFDRQELLVASNDPVQLAWAGHTGRADGVEVKLGAIRGGQKPVGLPVGPVRAVRLMRNVELELALPVQGAGENPSVAAANWRIDCDGPLAVDPVRLVAEFFNNVTVKRPTVLDQWDTLECQQLGLRFRRKPDPMKAKPGDRSGRESMEFVQLVAAGTPVSVGSVARDLEARSRRVVYQAETGTVELRGDVVARWKQGQLNCQHAVLARGVDGRIDRASCRGSGSLTWQQPGTPTLPMIARWSRQMTLAPDPETGQDLVVLDGQPVVKYGTDSALTANSIRIWLARDSRRSKGEPGSVGARGEGIQPKRLIAREKVGAITPQAYVFTSLLDVTFEPVAASADQRSPTSRSGDSPAVSGGPATRFPDESTNPPVVHAESIRARLSVPSDGGGWALQELVTRGQVRVSHQKRATDDPVEISGDRVRIVKTKGDDYGLTISGRPARGVLGERKISGAEIQLDPHSGKGSVEGSGTLSVPLVRTVLSDGVRPGARLQIRWDERLVLDGTKLSFLGDVKAELENSRINCQQLDVTLNRPPEFSINSKDRQEIDIRTLRFRHSVRLTRYEFAPDKDAAGKAPPTNGSRPPVSKVSKARLASLTIEMSTGDAEAEGPGWIQCWWRGQSKKVPLAPVTLALANMPLVLDAAHWQYLRVDFARKSRGNIEYRFATFDDQVQGVWGQVARPGDTVDPDRLGRDAGWLQCDSLQVTQERPDANTNRTRPGNSAKTVSVKPLADSAGQNFTLQARGDATCAGRVAGQVYYGRAETISLNEATNRIVLSSLGTQKATLWRRTRDNGPNFRVDAQRVVYSPRNNELVLDRTVSGQVVPAGKP